MANATVTTRDQEHALAKHYQTACSESRVGMAITENNYMRVWCETWWVETLNHETRQWDTSKRDTFSQADHFLRDWRIERTCVLAGLEPKQQVWEYVGTAWECILAIRAENNQTVRDLMSPPKGRY